MNNKGQNKRLPYEQYTLGIPGPREYNSNIFKQHEYYSTVTETPETRLEQINIGSETPRTEKINLVSETPKLIPEQHIPVIDTSKSKIKQHIPVIETSGINSTSLLYSDPATLCLLIDIINLQNCLKSITNLDQIQDCISLYIKGTMSNSIGSNYIITNLMPVQGGGCNTSQILSPIEIQKAQTSNFIAYNFSGRILGQFYIDYKLLWSLTNSTDINHAISSSIKGFNSESNTYLNLNQLVSGITINSSGVIIEPKISEQNFELVDIFYNNLPETKTLILSVCIILYLFILSKK
jgi:hypothetical protein